MPDAPNPDQLRALLRPLAAEGDEPEMFRAYRAYYGLDFPARGDSVRSRLGCVQVAGYCVATQAWWPREPRGTLVLLHGYYDHMGLYRHVIDWALGLGFAVIACDLPGHGLSSGAPASAAGSCRLTPENTAARWSKGRR